METLRALLKAYRVARGERRIQMAWAIVKKASRYADREPFWETLKSSGIRPDLIRDAMRFLESAGELRIKRSIDGRRLYVSTLKDIRRNPLKLDRWLNPPSGGGARTPSPSRPRGR